MNNWVATIVIDGRIHDFPVKTEIGEMLVKGNYYQFEKISLRDKELFLVYDSTGLIDISHEFEENNLISKIKEA